MYPASQSQPRKLSAKPGACPLWRADTASIARDEHHTTTTSLLELLRVQAQGMTITMGRGLSELQKKILCLAHENRVAEGRGAPNVRGGADLFAHEVLIVVFGFTSWRKVRDRNGTRGAGGQWFSRCHIGDAEYKAATVSVYRSFDRLEKRGLVVRVCGAISLWSGVNLTTEGVRMAQAVSVSSFAPGANLLTDNLHSSS